MFPAALITGAFALSFLGPFAMHLLVKRGHTTAARRVVLLAGLAAVYVAFAGGSMIGDWQDPFADADPTTLSNARVSHGGRGGLVILVLRFWPYALIAYGTYFGYQLLSLWNIQRRSSA